MDFPAHFLVALEGKSVQAVIDVFAGGVTLDARDLRALLKRVEGDKAELRPGLLRPMNARGVYSTSLNVPFAKNFRPDLLIHPWLQNAWTYPLAFVGFFVFLILVLVGSSDAVNLTDGLDGRAIGLMIIAAGAMTMLSFLSGNADFARYRLPDGRRALDVRGMALL